MIKAKSEQYYLLNSNGDRFNLYRESSTLQDTCFVIADGVDNSTNELSTYEKGIYTTIYTKSDSVTGVLSLEVCVLGDKKKDDLVSFIYRNLDILRVFKTKLSYGNSKNTAYCYCKITKENIERVKQSNDFKGTIEFEKFTEWFSEERIELKEIKTKENYAFFNKNFNLHRFSELSVKRLGVLARDSFGDLAPFFKIFIKGKCNNPKIVLEQKNNTQIMEWGNLALDEADMLFIDNILTIPNAGGIGHYLNGVDYFGKNKLQNKKIYSELLDEDEEYSNNNYVSFFNSLDLSYILKIENVMNASVIVVHRFIKW